MLTVNKIYPMQYHKIISTRTTKKTYFTNRTTRPNDIVSDVYSVLVKIRINILGLIQTRKSATRKRFTFLDFFFFFFLIRYAICIYSVVNLNSWLKTHDINTFEKCNRYWNMRFIYIIYDKNTLLSIATICFAYFKVSYMYIIQAELFESLFLYIYIVTVCKQLIYGAVLDTIVI